MPSDRKCRPVPAAVARVAAAAALPPTAQAVVRELARDGAMPLEVLAAATGRTPRTVEKWIPALLSAGWIEARDVVGTRVFAYVPAVVDPAELAALPVRRPRARRRPVAAVRRKEAPYATP